MSRILDHVRAHLTEYIGGAIGAAIIAIVVGTVTWIYNNPYRLERVAELRGGDLGIFNLKPVFKDIQAVGEAYCSDRWSDWLKQQLAWKECHDVVYKDGIDNLFVCSSVHGGTIIIDKFSNAIEGLERIEGKFRDQQCFTRNFDGRKVITVSQGPKASRKETVSDPSGRNPNTSYFCECGEGTIDTVVRRMGGQLKLPNPQPQ
jgi:hypothetical protein